MLLGGEGELGRDELEAAFLESGEDLADETTVDAIGLLKRVLWAALDVNQSVISTLTMM